MQPDTWLTAWQQHDSNQKTSTPHPASELVRTHAERIAHEAEDRLQKRQMELAEQRSSDNSPDVRIRAWERVHALRLPSAPGHPVLRSIAISTGLTLAQVEEEQSVRRARRALSAPSRPPDSV
ncbi:MAG: hypothetical protein KGJ68_04465 [Gammaproteobacteria bacterium]|nr:hypothetical protein [Gammaproteobacteria bacterium]